MKFLTKHKETLALLLGAVLLLVGLDWGLRAYAGSQRPETVTAVSAEMLSEAVTVVTRSRHQSDHESLPAFSESTPVSRDEATSKALLALLDGEWRYEETNVSAYSDVQLTLLDAGGTELTAVELCRSTNADGVRIACLYQGNGNLYVPADGELRWSEVEALAGLDSILPPNESEVALVETILLDGEPWADGLISAPRLAAAHDGQALLDELERLGAWTYDQTVAPASLEETLTFTLLDADGEPLRTLTLTYVPGADGEPDVRILNDAGDLYSCGDDAFTDWDDLMRELGLAEAT